jgi:hypothetical protein
MRSASECIWSTIAHNHSVAIDHDVAGDHGDHVDNNTDRAFTEQSIPAYRTSPHDYPRKRQGRCRRWDRTQPAWLDGYVGLVTDRVRGGWSCYLFTVMFDEIPGPRAAVISQMLDQVQRIYSTLLKAVHRRPRTAQVDELPVLVGAIDLPVYKLDRTSQPICSCNGGLHFNAVLLLPPRTRLKVSIVEHFRERAGMYAHSPVQRIHICPVTSDHGHVVDYVFKTVKNGRLAYDEATVVLPRTRPELSV